jgi:hypothetical protein
VTASAANKKNLIGLADRPGNDIKARLLLALTALYVERPTHTDEERRQYGELAARLIDVVDETTREIVVTVLHDHPTAPIEISRRPPQSATPAPASAPTVPSARLVGIVPAFVAAPVCAPTPASEALAPAQWGEAFFAANAAARRDLLAVIAKACEGQSTMPAHEVAPADCERLDAAALHGRIGELIREFERALDLPRALCERILNDPTGEPIVVAAMATRIPIAVLQRILLLVNPAVGHSVERVFDLTNLFYELDRSAAVRLTSLWRDKARSDEARSPPSPVRAAAETERPAGMRARFGALSERIQDRSIHDRGMHDRGVTSLSDRESGVRRDLRSR